MISAKSILSSVNKETHKRIDTLQLRFPRFILAQFNTHRVFSRNAASSRAIPTAKLIEQVRTDPVVPLRWGRNRPGMQATEDLSAPEQDRALSAWLRARDAALSEAEFLADLGVHKQVVNRILEPYLHVDVIVTATEWDNFFSLRLDDAAQPEIQELARQMKAALDGADVVEMGPGDWHIPYITEEEHYLVTVGALPKTRLLSFSAARCARVSYLNHDQTAPDPEKDLALAGRLLAHKHMSPFEHQALAYFPARTSYLEDLQRNFTGGWAQHRAMLESGFLE